MTLGEFRKQTQFMSGNLEIMIVKTDEENRYATSQSLSLKSIMFGGDDIPKKERPVIECLVLSDEL